MGVRKEATMDDAAVQEILIDFPEAGDLLLKLAIGPGSLTMRKGSGGPWVKGTYTDPSHSIPCKFRVDGGTAEIAQDRKIPKSFKLMPKFDLQLGDAHPFRVKIEAGANELIDCDFAGVPISGFDGGFGAGKIRIDQSEPNSTPMERFKLSNGATDLTLVNLANLNAERIEIEGGAAMMRLDFGGTLQRDCRAKISAGVAAVEVHIPATVAAKIITHTSLGDLNVGDGFTTREGGFWTRAALDGAGPVLTLEASSAVGSLKLRTS